MKPINYTKQFKKHLRQRFGHQPKVLLQFRDRTKLFQTGERNAPLDDHALIGKLKGFRAFSVAGDIRVIYHETATHYEFIDIGTHNQVYK